MSKIIIFGTGSAARRAFRYIQRQVDFEIVAFADNNIEQQGSVFFGLPVISAKQAVSREDWDFIWVASQWHQEISEGLITLGVSEHKLVPFFDSNPSVKDLWRMQNIVREDEVISVGSSFLKPIDLPKVLILSCESINESHGTGILLKRYFGAFPGANLLSLYIQKSGSQPWLEQSYRIIWQGPKGLKRIDEVLSENAFVPDVIFSTAFRESDLELLQMTLSVIGRDVPVVQYFLDLLPIKSKDFFRKLRGLSPSIHTMWGLTKPMCRVLKGELNRTVEYVSGLHFNISNPSNKKRCGTREFSREFRTVLIGNFYNPEIVPFLKELWKGCKEKLPELSYVEWFGDSQRIQALFDDDINPSPEFIWHGSWGGERLRGADLALLPFNRGTTATSNYLRYSFPSRISEYISAGLPIFAFATVDTPLSSFVKKTGCGRVVSGNELSESVSELVDFIQNVQARDLASQKSLDFAANSLDLNGLRSWFYEALVKAIRESATK